MQANKIFLFHNLKKHNLKSLTESIAIKSTSLSSLVLPWYFTEET